MKNEKKKKEKEHLKGKEHFFCLEKKALKNHPRLYFYHQILMSVPKLFNISQKDDFTQQIKTIFKRNTKDITRERMDNDVNYAKLERDILVVGRTCCGKTTFVQNLAKKKKKKNRMFGEIKIVIFFKNSTFNGKGR